jgi:ATP-grasp domain
MSVEPGRGPVSRGWSADVRDAAGDPKPAVVFIDDGPWENFFHLAAALRKSGTRTVHVTVGPAGWQPDHLLFDRTVTLPVGPDAGRLAEVLSTEYVADVQTAETLATTTYAALSLLPTARRSDLWAGRSDLLDKFAVGPVLRDIGLRTPDTLPASVSGRNAVAELSLPIVLKKRVGASGVDVRIIDSLGELEEALAQIECLDEWFFERYVSGRSMVCAGCVSDDGIQLIATYEVLQRKYPLGPSSEVKFHDDATVTETGMQLMSALKVRGFICFDIIRDADGTDWIHDVNTRIFGGFSMCQSAGFDFLGAYRRCLAGHGPVEPTRLGVAGTREFTFPGGRRDVFRAGPQRTIQWARRHENLLGSRYLLFLLLRRSSAWGRLVKVRRL